MRAKKEQRFAVIVATSPVDMSDVFQSRPEDPIKARIAKSYGNAAYLS